MKDYQFFPTPIESARFAAMKADIRPKHSLLEPSAGNGVLLRQAIPFAPLRVTAVEANHDRYYALHRWMRNDRGITVMCCDFLLMVWREKDKFDRILMNPPFNPARDVTHVLHAYEHALKRGGLLTAIITPRFQSSTSKESAYLRELVFRVPGACGRIPLPQNHDRGATRDTVLIQLRRPL